jgi:cellulose synthase/poly-beta-1,6-N-acetylglucosamine synthase-like glycosyltransferase
MISVIVPVRNEQENIVSTLLALKNQTYGNFEVIVVNDHSSDGTIDAVAKNKFPNVSVLNNREAGKKAALQTGIDIAKGELIATTDGDCVMNEYWLESIQKTFTDENIVFAFGAVAIQSDKRFFSKVQVVEFASLIGSGAATSSLGFPTMSNGANLAFRKSAFKTVGGYEGNKHIASGDDEFLMRKMHKHFPHGIKFIPYRVASVLTTPKESLSELASQRLRWAGKWKHNSSFATVVLAIYIFVTQFCVLAGLITLFTSFNYPVALLLMIKFAFEASFISRVCRFSKSNFSWTAFLFLQVFYPLYVIFVGTLASFAKPTWKGRELKNQSIKHNA